MSRVTAFPTRPHVHVSITNKTIVIDHFSFAYEPAHSISYKTAYAPSEDSD